VGTIIDLPVCQRKPCGQVIKSSRFYINILNGLVFDRTEAKNAKLPYPEDVLLGETPIIGPFCEECADLHIRSFFGHAGYADVPSPR